MVKAKKNFTFRTYFCPGRGYFRGLSPPKRRVSGGGGINPPVPPAALLIASVAETTKIRSAVGDGSIEPTQLFALFFSIIVGTHDDYFFNSYVRSRTRRTAAFYNTTTIVVIGSAATKRYTRSVFAWMGRAPPAEMQIMRASPSDVLFVFRAVISRPVLAACRHHGLADRLTKTLSY